MKNTHNKVWFITGASAGFGRAFSEYAIEKGYNVVATARRVEKLNEIQALAPAQVLALPMDVTNTDHIQKVVPQAIAHFGKIDVLINNAGYGIVGAVEETSEAELRAIMETNFFGAIAVTRALIPQFRRQKQGAIVNISSSGGQFSVAGFGPYSATKFALEGISEALAGELAPFGIKTLIVEPGVFRTDFAGEALRRMPIIEGYEATVGNTRSFADAMHNTQAGDPKKAAAAIELALQAEHTPLRLQLGDDSVEVVKAHAETLLKDLATWESVARSTKFEET